MHEIKIFFISSTELSLLVANIHTSREIDKNATRYFFTIKLSEQFTDGFCHTPDGDNLYFILPGIDSFHIV